MADRVETIRAEPAQPAPEFLTNALAELKNADIKTMPEDQLRELAGKFHDMAFTGTNGDQAAIEQRVEQIIEGIDEMKKNGNLTAEQAGQISDFIREAAKDRESFVDAVIRDREKFQNLTLLNAPDAADPAQSTDNLNLQSLLSNMGDMNNFMGIFAMLAVMVIAAVTKDTGLVQKLTNAPGRRQEPGEVTEVTAEELKKEAGDGAMIIEGDFPDGGVFEHEGQTIDLQNLHGKDIAIAKNADGTYTLAVADPDAENGRVIYSGIEKEDLGREMQTPIGEAFPEQPQVAQNSTPAPAAAPAATGS